jgi:hypothetical protein
MGNSFKNLLFLILLIILFGIFVSYLIAEENQVLPEERFVLWKYWSSDSAEKPFLAFPDYKMDTICVIGDSSIFKIIKSENKIIIEIRNDNIQLDYLHDEIRLLKMEILKLQSQIKELRQ